MDRVGDDPVPGAALDLHARIDAASRDRVPGAELVVRRVLDVDPVRTVAAIRRTRPVGADEVAGDDRPGRAVENLQAAAVRLHEDVAELVVDESELAGLDVVPDDVAGGGRPRDDDAVVHRVDGVRRDRVVGRDDADAGTEKKSRISRPRISRSSEPVASWRPLTSAPAPSSLITIVPSDWLRPSIMTGLVMFGSASWSATWVSPSISNSIVLLPACVLAAVIASRSVHSVVVQPASAGVPSVFVLTVNVGPGCVPPPPPPRQARRSENSDRVRRSRQ